MKSEPPFAFGTKERKVSQTKFEPPFTYDFISRRVK